MTEISCFKITKKHKLGIFALIIVVMAEIVNVLPNTYDGLTIEAFYASNNNVDVGDPVTFHWSINSVDDSLTIRIKFGDGIIKLIPGAEYDDSYTYNYTCEGKFNATLMVQDSQGGFYWKSVPKQELFYFQILACCIRRIQAIP